MKDKKPISIKYMRTLLPELTYTAKPPDTKVSRKGFRILEFSYYRITFTL